MITHIPAYSCVYFYGGIIEKVFENFEKKKHGTLKKLICGTHLSSTQVIPVLESSPVR